MARSPAERMSQKDCGPAVDPSTRVRTQTTALAWRRTDCSAAGRSWNTNPPFVAITTSSRRPLTAVTEHVLACPSPIHISGIENGHAEVDRRPHQSDVVADPPASDTSHADAAETEPHHSPVCRDDRGRSRLARSETTAAP